MSPNSNDAAFQLNRREALKVGAGAVAAVGLGAQEGGAQEGSGGRGTVPTPGSMRAPGEVAPFIGPGYKNDYNRLGHNGPVDDTTRKIVDFVHNFDESLVTPSVVEWFNRTMIDSMASLIAGFEFEAPRILAKIASQLYPAGREKCTILGYGITTTPEQATFANATMMRETDFNDNMILGGHVSNIISAALAMGEALHKSGREVRNAICIGYEIMAGPFASLRGSPVAAAMMAGRLMGLDEDRLANAVALALVPNVGLGRGQGVLNMWKSVCQTEPVRAGVWAALFAREGMTCNPQPFEGPGGFWEYEASMGGPILPNGMGREFTLPLQPGKLIIESGHWFKRRPAEASTQGMLLLIPEIRAWVGNPDSIASVHWDAPPNFDETNCAPRFDPRNRQTADHSFPYVFSRALLDGDIFLDSYTDEKIMDPAARAIMNKMTSASVRGWDGLGAGRLTIAKTSGETKYWDTYKGVRVLEGPDYMPMTAEEVKSKFDRVCAFHKVSNAQRDEAYKVWGNLSSLADFADAMKVLAKYGQPKPL